MWCSFGFTLFLLWGLDLSQFCNVTFLEGGWKEGNFKIFVLYTTFPTACTFHQALVSRAIYRFPSPVNNRNKTIYRHSEQGDTEREWNPHIMAPGKQRLNIKTKVADKKKKKKRVPVTGPLSHVGHVTEVVMRHSASQIYSFLDERVIRVAVFFSPWTVSARRLKSMTDGWREMKFWSNKYWMMNGFAVVARSLRLMAP